jgi:hypothetical protein
MRNKNCGFCRFSEFRNLEGFSCPVFPNGVPHSISVCNFWEAKTGFRVVKHHFVGLYECIDDTYYPVNYVDVPITIWCSTWDKLNEVTKNFDQGWWKIEQLGDLGGE